MQRHLVVTGVLLAVGVVFNLAVAWTWGLATSFRHGSALELYARLGADHHWTVHRWNRAAATRIVSRHWHGFGGGPHPRGSPTFLLASWGRIEPPDAAAPGEVTQIDEAWGFPMRTVACGVTVRGDRNGPTLLRTDLLELAEGNDDDEGPSYLPLRLIWWGFAVNSALYALLALVVHAAVRDLSRLAGLGAARAG